MTRRSLRTPLLPNTTTHRSGALDPTLKTYSLSLSLNSFTSPIPFRLSYPEAQRLFGARRAPSFPELGVAPGENTKKISLVELLASQRRVVRPLPTGVPFLLQAGFLRVWDTFVHSMADPIVPGPISLYVQSIVWLFFSDN